MEERIRRLIETTPHADPQRIHQFLKRLEKGDLSRRVNPESHFCVYFLPFDQEKNEVFVGLHRKSGLWLASGGHFEYEEAPGETLEREIREEWGLEWNKEGLGAPMMLTISEIDNPEVSCRFHYDFWYFIPVEKRNFKPDEKNLIKEFKAFGWLSFSEARNVVTDPNTLRAFDLIENSFHDQES